jgi:uncharacterized protein YndB with AHSA1/START domain
MTTAHRHQLNPDLDLLLERVVAVPRTSVWAAWTRPEQLMKWFTPTPWATVECEIDLRPGGIFRTVMRSPDGNEFSRIGCYLEVVENERLVWTSVLGPDYRPQQHAGDVPPFTATISLEPAGDATRYSALVAHSDAGSCARHAELGFYDGWGTVLDQLVAMVAAERTASADAR